MKSHLLTCDLEKTSYFMCKLFLNQGLPMNVRGRFCSVQSFKYCSSYMARCSIMLAEVFMTQKFVLRGKYTFFLLYIKHRIIQKIISDTIYLTS